MNITYYYISNIVLPLINLQKRPPDNAFYVKTCNKNPKKTKWWYHGEYFQRILCLVAIVYLQ